MEKSLNEQIEQYCIVHGCPSGACSSISSAQHKTIVDAIQWAKNILFAWRSESKCKPQPNINVLALTSDLNIKVSYWDGEEWWWQDGFPIGKNSDTHQIAYSSSCVLNNVIAWLPIPTILSL